MDAGRGNPPTQPPDPQAGERLESWKEIANYLKRGVTTVQRWEKTAGLPVHRHERVGSIFAYKAELDVWWQDGHARLEKLEEVEKATSRRGLWWVLAAAAVLVAVAGIGAAYWSTRAPALPFEERDWVLIAQSDNRTGEPVFDATLEYALERELSNSRFVNVVPRERANDALELMKKPLDTVLTASVAREVAVRDGGIRALLAGRVEKLNNTYLLTVALVNPVDGVQVVAFSEEAVGQKAVVPALRRLTARVRQRLGEKLVDIQLGQEKLEKVTTSSLRALHFFSQGIRLKIQGELAAAEVLLRQAVTEDPDFASAHFWLAFVMKAQRKPPSEYLPHAGKALELSVSLSENERYFIRGAYHILAEEPEKAIAPLQVLLQLYPDKYRGATFLALAYSRLDQIDKILPLRLRMAQLRPLNFQTTAQASRTLLLSGQLNEARRLAGRARELYDPKRHEEFAALAAFVLLFPANDAWLRGDLSRVERELVAVAQRFSAAPDFVRTQLAYAVGSMYLSLGQLARATRLYQTLPPSELRESALHNAALARGDSAAVLASARRSATADPALGVFLIHAGLAPEARKLLRSARNDYPFFRLSLQLVRGELAVADGRSAEAKAFLQEAVTGLKRWGHNHAFYLAAGSLARLYDEEGNLASAIRVLENASQGKGTTNPMYLKLHWMRSQWELARLYRKAGRFTEAAKIEDELRRLLAYADPDHAIARELKAASTLRTEAVPR